MLVKRLCIRQLLFGLRAMSSVEGAMGMPLAGEHKQDDAQDNAQADPSQKKPRVFDWKM